jgi:signal transduction histidine kinase
VVVGDRVQVQQVLINLLLNAMDAVANVSADRRAIDVSVECDDGHVAISVRDRGHGIAPEHLPRLFESFFSTKREGMGLGLSIARSLVESHGGRIWAENGPGPGAVFRIVLPAPGPAGLASQERA